MNNFDLNLSCFFEMIPDLVCIAGKDGYLKKVNSGVIKKLGYTEAELCADPISSFIHPEDMEKTRHNRDNLINGKVLHNFLNRFITKDGEIVWLEWTSIYFSDKEVVLAIAKDVTGRKQKEKEAADEYNKFKSLATHFKKSIENDRKHFAYELHEELAQLVSAVNMDLGWINKNFHDMPGNLKTRIDHASEVSGLLIKTIQRLSFSISPIMLDDFGLNATLEWLCKEFSLMHGISCEFEPAYDETSLTHEMKIDFFRICQESLTSVLDHSLASNIKIRIKDTGTRIQLCILDNGKGFDTSRVELLTTEFINIRERAASINAQVNLQSFPDGETCVCLTVEKQLNPVV